MREESAQDAALPFLLFGKEIGGNTAGPSEKKAALEKPKVVGCRACGAGKRGFWANRQNREFATWGNAAKNRPKNAAFIHAELDKRGISA